MLNSDAPVGAKTRDAVERAIIALGYVPSSAALMMRSNRSGIIGLIPGAISLPNKPVQPQGLPGLFIVQGIQHAISPSERTLMIADTAGRSDQVPHLIQTFLRHRVEGLIYVAEHHRRVTFPEVSPDTPLDLANCFDDRGGPQRSAARPDRADRAGHWHDRALRDPWVMKDPDGPGWLMYFTARAPARPGLPRRTQAGPSALPPRLT